MRSIDRDLRGLEDKPEVFATDDQPFEKPAKEFVPGPFYMNIEEVMPELGETQDRETQDEGKKLPVDRRDFMRLFSAGAMLATAGCVYRPVEKAVPYVEQPKDFIPGIANYYATTIDRVGVVVKTREGRPVFIEGNPKHPLSQGATTVLALSELQALFHPDRPNAPKVKFGDQMTAVTWDEIYDGLAAKVKASQKVGILVKGSTGHSQQFYKDFLSTIGQSTDNLYVYETNALYNAVSEAHRLAFGVDGMPRSDLRRSKLLIGVGTNFLEGNGGVAPIFESKSWSVGHTFRSGAKGRFVQFESRMTVTGGKSDERHVIGSGDELAITLALVEALLNRPESKGSAGDKNGIRAAVSANKAMIDEAKARLKLDEVINKLAGEALSKKAVLIAGESGGFSKNGTQVQLAAIMANVLLGAYADRLLYFDQGWFKNPGRPGDVARFIKDAPTYDLLFVIDVNPAFTLPASSGIDAALKGIKSIVSMQAMPTETCQYAEFQLNTHNPLEAWGDEELVAGFWSIQQPAVRPVANSRQAEDILLWTASKFGKPVGAFADYRAYLRNKWTRIYKESGINKDFDTFFKAIQRKGFFVTQLSKRDMPALKDVSGSMTPAPVNAGFKLVAYLDGKLGDGYGADRPVLQEAGDSMTTVAWDTWVAINPHKAREIGVKYNDVVTVKGPNGAFEAAVYPMPGLHYDTIAVPRGNGHKLAASRASERVGIDPLVALAFETDPLTGDVVTAGQTVEITKTGRFYQLCSQQKHNDIANRFDIMPIIPMAQAVANVRKEKDLDNVPDLYPSHTPREGDLRGSSWLFPEWKASTQYRWGMAIDLERCTGCGNCTVACDLENNVPQVGREQVRMGRRMHWIRIDRYFSGAVDNPEVSFQPVTCQHCNHAPCEAVCPVFATTHEPEGLNAQTYNRCVGTRYCANACPYKVRRFNWYTYKWNIMGSDPMDRNPRALNPDVTVRTRGIMEKCTFCVQRIRDAKHNAKQQNRMVFDGEIRPACQTACPTDAIVFGNLLDPNSRVARARKDNRAFLLLGGNPELKEYGLKTLPNLNYMAKVKHDGTEGFAAGDGHDHGAGAPGHGHP
jgi:molybdopterin-containing oxidoreductase family iron-sulfur binding subunit